MATGNDISQRTKSMQERVFRLACQSDTLKGISLDSGIPYSTLRSYAGHNGEPAEMPVSALYRLVGVIPDELLSLLLPDGRQIVQLPEGLDFDAVADDVTDFLKTKNEFHRPDSECGPAIGPSEHEALAAKVVQLRSAAA